MRKRISLILATLAMSGAALATSAPAGALVMPHVQARTVMPHAGSPVRPATEYQGEDCHNLGSGLNLVTRLCQEWNGHTPANTWDDSSSISSNRSRIYNPCCNDDHGLLYAEMYVPNDNTCNGYAYIGAIPDGATKFPNENYCSLLLASSSSKIKYHIRSIAPNGGVMGDWCITTGVLPIPNNPTWSAAGGLC